MGTNQRLVSECGSKLRLNYSNAHDRRILDRINASPLPPIIVTDSSHIENDTGAFNSAFTAIFIYEGKEAKDMTDAFETEWTPILALGAYLPDKIGTDKTDNGHAECHAVNLAEEILPVHVAAVIVSDSLSTITGYRALRDGIIPSHRVLIRRILPGLGRAGAVRLLRNLGLWSIPSKNLLYNSAAFPHSLGNDTSENFTYQLNDDPLIYEHMEEYNETMELTEDSLADITKWHFNNHTTRRTKNVIHNSIQPSRIGPFTASTQSHKMKIFAATAKNWVGKAWKKTSHDQHPLRTIVHVPSHQFEKNDRDKPTKKCSKPTPCLAFARANDTVDRLCDLKLSPNNNRGKAFVKPDNIELSPHSTRYFVTFNGLSLNRNYQKHMRVALSNERRLIAASRDTHGFVQRVENDIDVAAPTLLHVGGVA